MDSMEFNKIAGASIGALLVFLLLNFFSTLIYGTEDFAPTVLDKDGKPVLAYALNVEPSGTQQAAAEPQVDLVALFTDADVAKGEKIFGRCGACHSIEQGVNKVGPSLHGVIHRDIASLPDFSYSDELKSLKGAWTPEEIFHFIKDPKAYAPGTKMTFAGLKDPQERADVIAYLNKASGNPIDLTQGLEKQAPASQAAAEPTSTPGSSAPAPNASAPAAGQELAAAAGNAVPEGSQPAKNVEVTGQTTVNTKNDQTKTETTPEQTQAPSGAGQSQQGQQAANAPASGAAAGAAAGGGGIDWASGDAGAGEKIFRRCQACHSIEEGKNKVGPSLYNVIDRNIASEAGYSYSDAMKKQQGKWTPDKLFEYLKDPRGMVPGTKMTFAGLKDPKERIDVITYINKESGNHVTLK